MKLYNRVATSLTMLVAYVSSFSMMINVQGTSSSASTTIPIPTTKLKNVAIIGGTHGNEYTGVWIIKSFQQRQQQLQELYPNLNISTILGNPDAHYANKRFIHTDLNREFSYDKLCELDYDDNSNNMTDETIPVEALRARELDKILGSKCMDSESDVYDVAIDLHSTTSNMGTTLIVNEGDILMAQGAAYVTQQCTSSSSSGSSHSIPSTDIHCLMHAIPDKGQRPNLSSTSKHGFTIEVGPVPQGLLRHDAVIKTECALHALLDFLQQYYSSMNTKDTSDGTVSPIIESLVKSFPTGKVPAFRTIPARRHGEMSGKITWPSDIDNPNFPQWMIHESVQDHDYQKIKVGDPLFVQFDGSILYYDGAYGSEIYLIFINEGGYYYSSSGTGISVAMKTQYDIYTAILDPIETNNITENDVKQEL
jgi:aspartoacylase